MNAIVFLHPLLAQNPVKNAAKIKAIETRTGRSAIAINAKKIVLLPPPTLITSRKKNKHVEDDWFTNGPNNAA